MYIAFIYYYFQSCCLNDSVHTAAAETKIKYLYTYLLVQETRRYTNWYKMYGRRTMRCNTRHTRGVQLIIDK